MVRSGIRGGCGGIGNIRSRWPLPPQEMPRGRSTCRAISPVTLRNALLGDLHTQLGRAFVALPRWMLEASPAHPDPERIKRSHVPYLYPPINPRRRRFVIEHTFGSHDMTVLAQVR